MKKVWHVYESRKKTSKSKKNLYPWKTIGEIYWNGEKIANSSIELCAEINSGCDKILKKLDNKEKEKQEKLTINEKILNSLEEEEKF